MKTLVSVCEKQSEVFISSTLYRALFILRLLFQKEMSIAELKSECQKDKIIGTKISDDTIRMTIATLKSVGCDFAKPSIKNGFKYKLLTSPLKYSLSIENIKFLSEIRKQLAPLISLNNLIKVNDLYEKINKKMNETDNKFDLSREIIYPNINMFVLEKMYLLCKKNVFVSVLYNSKNQLKTMNIVPYFMKYENDTVYIWCYNENHESFSFLRMDKMMKINGILPNKKVPEIEKNKVVLKIENCKLPILETFYKVKILETQGKDFIVEVEYMNNFHIVQTVLELSPDCAVVSDGVIKDKVMEKINLMKRLYKA